MKRKNKSGFTLIELLAVIVILAIIALIAVPVVMNIITKSRKSAFKDSAYGIIKAGELYYANQLLEPDGMEEDKTFDFSSGTEGLDIKGTKPTAGTMTVTKEGKVAISVTDGKYCVTKGFEDADVTITDGTCVSDSGDNTEKTLSELATTGTFTTVNGSNTSEINEVDDCALDKTEGSCEPGTEFAIKVNEDETYKFYVLNDDGNKVTLILDRNLGDKVAWYADAEDSSYGPITAANKLDELTDDEWSNIPKKNYVYEDDADESRYESFTKNMRVRLPGYYEMYELLNPGLILPGYLGDNFNGTGDDNAYGYWTSGTSGLYTACDVHYYMTISLDMSVNNGNYVGVRPVIELYK